MKKKILILLLITIILEGCVSSEGNFNMETQKEDSQTEIQTGVYYAAIENPENQNYRAGGCYSYASLYYAGGIYTSSKKYRSEDVTEIPKEALTEGEIGTAYGNHNIYWSERNKLVECTQEGVLYNEADFRIALFYEEKVESTGEIWYNLIIFEKLNDIWLDQGKELFQTKLHLDKAVRISDLSMEDDIVTEFLDALFEAKFIDPKKEGLPDFEKEEYRSLNFYDSLGWEISLRIYQGGYVIYIYKGEKFIVKVDENL